MTRRLPLILALLSLLAGCRVAVVGTSAVAPAPLATKGYRPPVKRAAAFPVWDTTLLTRRPKAGIPGTLPATLVYSWQLDGMGAWADGAEHERIKALPTAERPLPDEAQIKRIAAAVPAGHVLVWDIEVYGVGDDNDHAGHERQYRNYGQIARWAREANPWVRQGCWSSTPDGRNAAKGLLVDAFDRNLELWLELVAPYVDFIADGYYIGSGMPMDDWRAWLEFKTSRLAVARKPQYAFINVDSDRPGWFAEALAAARVRCAGVFLWSNPGVYSGRADWVKALAN